MGAWTINRGRIRMELVRRDLTQNDLAALVGISKASVSRVLNGLQESPRVVARMATVLGVPLEEVLQVSDLQRTA